jgi:hypothetical protein
MSEKEKEKKGPPFKIIPGSIVKGTGGGYMVCQTDPIHPRAITLKDHKCKYVYVHRVVLENKLGRLISDDELSQVGHKDKDRTNNAPSNLELDQLGPHQSRHMKENKVYKSSPYTKPGHKHKKASLESIASQVVLNYLNSQS